MMSAVLAAFVIVIAKQACATEIHQQSGTLTNTKQSAGSNCSAGGTAAIRCSAKADRVKKTSDPNLNLVWLAAMLVANCMGQYDKNRVPRQLNKG